MPTKAEESKSAYQRVLETRTIRCGYNYYEPVIWRDAETQQLKGIFVDYMEAFAKATNLKIEWTAEVGWGDVATALKAKKIDAMCAGKWADGKDGVQIGFSVPVFYNAIEAYVRADDHRFDKDLSLINAPEVRVAMLEGGVTQDIAQEDFPKAKEVALSIMSTDADILLNVATNKADVTFTSHGPALGYMKTNPDKIRRVAADKPLRVFGVTTAVDIAEQELLTLVNTATNQLLNSGVIDKILKKYEKDYPGAFARVAKPYEVSKE